MKRIPILLIAAVAAVSCHQKSAGIFTVRGKVTHASGKLFLEELPFAGNQPQILDSTTVGVDGKFSLSAAMVSKSEAILRLAFQGGPDIILVNDNSPVEIEWDAADGFRHPSISGSDATSALYDFFDAYRRSDSSALVASRALDSLESASAKDSLVRIARASQAENFGKMNSLVKNFVNTSSSPASIFYVLVLGTKTMDPAQLAPLAQTAAARFPSYTPLNTFSAMLKQKAQPAEPAYALMNKQAPGLIMETPEGSKDSISHYRGKYVLVDFWASWCGPCRGENPNVVKAWQRYKDRNFTILGVSLDQDKAAWTKAIADDGLAWHQMSDLKQWESAAVGAFGFDGIPFNVLLDPSGKIIASSLRGEALEKKLGEVLK